VVQELLVMVILLLQQLAAQVDLVAVVAVVDKLLVAQVAQEYFTFSTREQL
jgi:hypothetical protein